MITSKTVNIKLPKLQRFAKIINTDLRRGGSGPVRKMLKQWAFVYRTFLRDRYRRFSKGGGNWPPLKPGTLRRRRGKGRGVAILIDTNTMFTAFTPAFSNKPGQLEEDIPFGVKVGVSDSGTHPNANMSIKQLILVHHFGRGVVPERKIVVPPNTAVIKDMRDIAVKAMKETKNSA